GPISTWRELAAFGVMGGLTHGLVWGSLVGTLAGFEPDWGLSAIQGALLGAGIGVPAFGLLAVCIVVGFMAAEVRPSFQPVRDLLRQAAEESRGLVHGHLGPEHDLLAVLHDGDSTTARLLARSGLSPDQFRAAIAGHAGLGPG